MTSHRMVRRRGMLFVLFLGLLLGSIPPYTLDAQTNTSSWITVLIDGRDQNIAQTVSRQGGVQLASYDSFSVWKIPANERQRAEQHPSIAIRDSYNHIYLRDITLNTQQPAPTNVPLPQANRVGEQLWLIQFVGPVQDNWLNELRKLELEPVIAMPTNGFLVRGNQAALQTLDSGKTPVQWMSPYHPWYRLSPLLREVVTHSNSKQAKSEMIDITVQLVSQKTTAADLARLQAWGGTIYKQPSTVLGFTNITLQVPTAELSAIAAWPMVYNVEPWYAPELLDEVQGQILAGQLTTSGGAVIPSAPGYLAWLDGLGFPQDPNAYPIVDVVDDGLDLGNAANIVDANLYELGDITSLDRVAYAGNCTADTTGNAVGGHGHLNANIVAGYNDQTTEPHQDANGYNRGLGISPYSRVASTKIFANAGSYNVSNCGNTDQGVVEASYQAGATMTSNSWGCGPPLCGPGNVYDASSQAYDALTRDASGSTAGNQEMLHVFSAGNSGTSGLGTPGTAKNVLTVGATENVRDQGIVDGCNNPNGDNADDLATFSSRGPTTDGRAKPDIVAPGTHVQASASPDPGFNGSGVCGASDGSYYPPNQTLYTWSSGTSHSAPAAAGAASLVYEYYGRVIRPGLTPSPAMLKALILNAPRYLDGLDTGGTYPTSTQGWGDVSLDSIFDGTPRLVYDQSDVFADSGESTEYTSTIVDPGKPVRVSLVWSDAPGATSGASYVNNLNLQVETSAGVYLGNEFDGAWSITGGTADLVNNVENVFIPAGITGPITVTVTAENITGDAIPGNADTTEQDYALVIYNAGNNDPATPDASFETESSTVIEADTTLTADVSLTTSYTDTVTVDYIVQGTATKDVDYTVSGSSVSFAPGETTASISITLIDDAIYEGDETIDIVLVNSSNADLIAPLRYRFTINDNEPAPLLGWETDTRDDQEADTSLVLPIELSSPSGVTVRATIATSGTAELGADYRLLNNSVTIAAGATSVTVTVEILDDQLDEFDETIILSLTDIQGAEAGIATSAITVMDNDEMPSTMIGKGEAKTETFSYTNVDGVAIPDNDPQGVTTSLDVSGFGGPITDIDFSIDGSACSSTGGSTTVGLAHTWVGDLILELTAPDGTSSLLINRAGSGTIGSSGNNFCQTVLDDQNGSLWIEDIASTDAPYTGVYTPHESLSVFNNSIPDGTWMLKVSDNANLDTGTIYAYSLIVSGIELTETMVLTVSETYTESITLLVLLDAPSGRTVQVPYNVSGTTNANDHTLTSGVLTFAPGQSYQEITFNVLSTPSNPEPLEVAIITLGEPDYATLSSQTRYELWITDPNQIEAAFNVLLPAVRK